MENNQHIAPELLQTITDFHHGHLHGRELDDFKRLMELDDDFKAQVEYVKNTLINESKKNSKQKASLFYNVFTVAIAIAIAVGSLWYFSTPKNEKLYAAYFKPDPDLQIPLDSLGFTNAVRTYKFSDYKTAIKTLKNIATKTPENDSINYFLGLTYMANNKEEHAIPFLEYAVEAPDDFAYLNKAYYYLGLAYLKEGNIRLAKKNLSLSNLKMSQELLGELN